MSPITSTFTLLGVIVKSDNTENWVEIRLRSGNIVKCHHLGGDKNVFVLNNLDGLSRDLIGARQRAGKHLEIDARVIVSGICQESDGAKRYDARNITRLHWEKAGSCIFESEKHWWLRQILVLADEWLQDLFKNRRSYTQDDFAELYRTNLNILGMPTDDSVQEMATLSRLIYGLSSAYLLTGCDRFLLAARAGVEFQRGTFRSLAHSGRTCLWFSARKNGKYGTETFIAARNGVDAGTIPLYEQIYALAGLAQYYRITGDHEALDDIRRTVDSFQLFFRDRNRRGFFSHIDPVSMMASEEALGINKEKKNWNSVGDHIPAYLVNILLALDPVPTQLKGQIEPFLEICQDILDETTYLIVKYFVNTETECDKSPFVLERFDADWNPDLKYDWQQDRAIVGHNLKIAWNLSRVANYYRRIGKKDKAKELTDAAKKVADSMKNHGLDLARGGCYDGIERHNKTGETFAFPWLNTKDFWQQEQAVLAYYALYNSTEDPQYLELARDCAAFWNKFFLDRDNKGIFFRTTAEGMPVIEEQYGYKAKSDIAGYHAFELNYLAHIYIRAAMALADGDGREDFCIYFKPSGKRGPMDLNVFPDMMDPATTRLVRVTVEGKDVKTFDPVLGRVSLDADCAEREVVAMFQVTGKGDKNEGKAN